MASRVRCTITLILLGSNIISRAAFGGHLPTPTLQYQTYSFVVKYLSENVPEVISESKIKLFLGKHAPHPPSWPCAYTHGWGLHPLYFSKYLFCPPLANAALY